MITSSNQIVERLIIGALSTGSASWPDGATADLVQAVLVTSRSHGVVVLLNERDFATVDWPTDLRQELHREAIVWTIWDMRHQQVVKELLVALSRANVEAVLIKGTAVAYTLYSRPGQRQRGDTDLLVAVENRNAAHDVLTAMGFVQIMGVSGDFVSHQASYTLTAGDGSTHVIDLHWRINNSELLSRLFSFDELRRRAVAIPSLGPWAFGHGLVDALLIACMHRAAHGVFISDVHGVAQSEADRLIWLHDIHLLARRLSASDWREFETLAGQKQLCATCFDGLERARNAFCTDYPSSVRDALLSRGKSEPVTRYLNGSSTRQQWMNFTATIGLANKLTLLRELVFPPKAYIRHKYRSAHFVWLPWLYMRRFLEGVFKRLVGRRVPDQ